MSEERQDSPRTPLHTAIVKAIRDQVQDMYTAMPGVIEAFDWRTAKARVKPQIQEVMDSSGKYKPLPVVAGVPVVFPGGAGASLTMPLAAGDTGLIIFTKHALEVWLSRGGDVAPGDPRQFDLTDAVFVPGLRPFSVTSPAESPNALTLKNGLAKIKMEDRKRDRRTSSDHRRFADADPDGKQQRRPAGLQPAGRSGVFLGSRSQAGHHQRIPVSGRPCDVLLFERGAACWI